MTFFSKKKKKTSRHFLDLKILMKTPQIQISTIEL